MTTMNREEFLQICDKLGCPERGWQTAAVKKASDLGLNLTQPTLSLLFRDETKVISPAVAKTLRVLVENMASGKIAFGKEKEKKSNPDDELTDEEILEDVVSAFEIFQECVEQVICSTRPSLIVSGPPGAGKSFAIEKCEPYANGVIKRITGTISAPYLFRKLYEVRDGGVLVFDDCDSIFADTSGLNLLKGALDEKKPGQPKMISYLKDKKMVDENEQEIPKTFNFQGRICFMTNIDFEEQLEKNDKLTPHLEALLDRSGYISLGLSSRRRQFIYVRHICLTSEIMNDYGIDSEFSKKEILDFVETNRDKWRFLNLRLIAKLCRYYNEVPNLWKKHAKLHMKK